jgi:hypothetical protein
MASARSKNHGVGLQTIGKGEDISPVKKSSEAPLGKPNRERNDTNRG